MSMPTPLEIDAQSREKIETIIDQNFFVEAGAGSGKTSKLVNRMVAMIKGGIPIEKICAITFTKAAANEFYARFQKELIEASEDFPLCKEAAQNIDLCFMGTIDSFCNMILSEHPSAAKIPSDTINVSKPELNIAYNKFYSDVLDEKYGAELKDKATRFNKYFSHPREVFSKTMSKIMDSRYAKIQYDKPVSDDFDALLKNEKAIFSGIVNDLLDSKNSEVVKLNDATNKGLKSIKHNKNLISGEWDLKINTILRTLKAFSGITLKGDTDLNMFSMYGDDVFESPAKITKASTAKVKKEFIDSITNKINYQLYCITMDFVDQCVEILANELRLNGQLTFFDYLLYLRNLLKEDAENDGTLINHISQRHSYFLIDEFQDTNPMQAEIFFYLAAEKPVANWWECIPRKGSLFIVGDPKQSIYRFRNADVSSYLRIRNMFTDDVGEVLYLTKNFRSTPEMCKWFNDTFTKLLPCDNENQSKFNEIPIDKDFDNSTFKGTFFYSVNKDCSDEDRIISIVKLLVNNPRYKIQDKDDEPSREIKYSDFMIITPTKTNLGKIMNALSKENIPSWVEGNVPFTESPAFATLAKIYSAIAFPNDKIKIYGALTSKAFGISDIELSSKKQQGLKLNVFSDNSSFPGAISDALSTLKDYVYRAKSFSPATLFSVLLHELKIFNSVDSFKLDYCYYALELLKSKESTGEISSIQDGAEFLETLIDGSSDIERSLSLTQDSNGIHIANLHKVKGLEAPIVILASPNKKSRTPENRIELSNTDANHWIFEISNDNSFGALLKSGSFETEKEKEVLALAAEDIRLLYVAATRAKSALFVASKKTRGEAESSLNPWAPLIDFIDDEFTPGTPEVCEVPEAATALDIYDAADDGIISPASKSAEKSYSIKRPSTIKVKSKTSSEDDYEDTEESESDTTETKKPTRPFANVFGTMAHRLMEVLVSSNNSVDLEFAVNEIHSEYSFPGIDFLKDLREVGETIRNGGYDQGNSVPKDILNELLAADEVHCEVPFCYKDIDDNGDTIIWNGVIDVAYLKDGKWHIVDYKTNADPDDLDGKYQGQLTAYIKAFEEMTGCKPDALIYHIG